MQDDSHAVFPIDSTLPELAVAADAAAMKDVFAQLFATSAAPLDVEGCRISRIRYREHTRCLVQYALTLRNPATGAATEQWVSGTMYADPGRAERLWHESAAGVTRRDSRGAMSPAGYIPELRMAIDLFPHDRKLPHAARLIEDRDAALDGEVLRAFGSGTWTIARWIAEPVRYREHLALVVRYTVDALDAGTGLKARKTFYLKTYPDRDQPRRMYEQLSELARHAAASPIGVRVDAPLACLDHLHALLIERTPGRPLDTLLRGRDAAAIDVAVRDAARALAAFNQSDAPTRRAYAVSDHLAAIDRAARVLRCACPELGDALAAVGGAVSAQLRDVAPRPTHRDMKPEHVLLAPSGVAFIDLDSCAAADPVLDPALMMARFTALAGSAGDSTTLERARATFAREYFARVPADWRLRLRPYYAGALVEVASGIFHRQEPVWRRRVAALVAAAYAAVVPASGRADVTAGVLRTG
jgi:hypothetical protein